jgi:hypothetical protein
MTKGLATLTMLLVCTVCLVLVLGPYYAIYGGVALVGLLGLWALVEDGKDKELAAAEKRSGAWLYPRRARRDSDEFGTPSFE